MNIILISITLAVYGAFVARWLLWVIEDFLID